ncbi:hypothetical protein DFH08DRAFT_952914 [Mycena albidolilacea]|uniref:Uncharacterized protein n=1 Tax=Mycena albidolilacea TaxID=1033008 RepID=A0AAD7AIU9_9AGAR|nr:hypothetical protein DFH08DRAFT_952914 [Mycena albidolilacea]
MLDSRYYPGPVMCFEILLPHPDLALTCGTSNGDRCILDNKEPSREPSIIVEGAWVRMIPSTVALLDSHHYIEPPARTLSVAHSILLLHLPRCRRVPYNAHETHHITRIHSHPQAPEPRAFPPALSQLFSCFVMQPKFHSPGIPLDAEVLHKAARYLPAVATAATTPVPPLCPLSHVKNFISRVKARAKASDE